MFALKIADKEHVHLLEYNQTAKDYYEDKLVYQEFSGKILKVNGDKGKFYSLVDHEDDIRFKIFNVKNQRFELISQLNSLQDTNPDFIRSFKTQSTMTEDILFQSTEKFTRIYDKDSGGETCLQDFYNYLPEAKDKSRTLINSSIRVCPRYKRVLMLFSYPETQLPRRILITPYFTDREIAILNSKEQQACWLDRASKAGKTVDVDSIEYKIYKESKMLLE